MSSCTDWHLGQFISTGRCLTAAHLKLSAHWNETKTVLKLFRSCFVSAKTKRFGGRVIYQKRNRGDFSSGFEYRDNSAHRTLGFRGTPVETAGVRRRGAQTPRRTPGRQRSYPADNSASLALCRALAPWADRVRARNHRELLIVECE